MPYWKENLIIARQARKTLRFVEKNTENFPNKYFVLKNKIIESCYNILEWIYCILIAFVLALVFRYYIMTPTVVKQRSMFPTLKEDQRLMLNRTMRITGKTPKVGAIITFEAPNATYYESHEADQTNPIAIYSSEPEGIFSKFVYYCLELTKKSFIKRVIAVEGDHVKIQDNKNIYLVMFLQSQIFLMILLFQKDTYLQWETTELKVLIVEILAVFL